MLVLTLKLCAVVQMLNSMTQRRRMFGSARTSNRNTWLHQLRHRLLKPTLRRRHRCHSAVVYVITVEVAMCESGWLCGCAIVCLSVGEAILGSCSAHGKMMMLVSIGNPYAARLAPGVWAVVQLHRVQRLPRSHRSGGRNVNRSSQRTAAPLHMPCALAVSCLRCKAAILWRPHNGRSSHTQLQSAP